MCWCFAIINNRLAEIYFDKDKQGSPKFTGHCYVSKNDFKTKVERKALENDIAKYQFTYRRSRYMVAGGY